MYSLKTKIEKLEEKRGLGDKQEVNVILRGVEAKENPFGFKLSTNKQTRDLTLEESLYLLYEHFTEDKPSYLTFKPAEVDNFPDYLRNFEGFCKDQQKIEALIQKLKKEGYQQPKKSTLPTKYIELIFSENKAPKNYLEK